MWFNPLSIIKGLFSGAPTSQPTRSPTNNAVHFPTAKREAAASARMETPSQEFKRRKVAPTCFTNPGIVTYVSVFGSPSQPRSVAARLSPSKPHSPHFIECGVPFTRTFFRFTTRDNTTNEETNGFQTKSASTSRPDSTSPLSSYGSPAASSVNNGKLCRPMKNVPAQIPIFESAKDGFPFSEIRHGTKTPSPRRGRPLVTPPRLSKPSPRPPCSSPESKNRSQSQCGHPIFSSANPPKRAPHPHTSNSKSHAIFEEDDGTLPDRYAGTFEDVRFYVPEQKDPACGENGQHHLCCGHWIGDLTKEPCGLNCKIPSLANAPFNCPQCFQLTRDALRDNLSNAEKWKLNSAKEHHRDAFVISYMAEFASKYVQLPGNVTETVTAIVQQCAYGRACASAQPPEPVAYMPVEEWARVVHENRAMRKAQDDAEIRKSRKRGFEDGEADSPSKKQKGGAEAKRKPVEEAKFAPFPQDFSCLRFRKRGLDEDDAILSSKKQKKGAEEKWTPFMETNFSPFPSGFSGFSSCKRSRGSADMSGEISDDSPQQKKRKVGTVVKPRDRKHKYEDAVMGESDIPRKKCRLTSTPR